MDNLTKEPKVVPTERPGIYKVDKGTLINRDNDALQAYKAKKRKMQEIDELKVQFQTMKTDIEEIKSLLKGLFK